jgi:hypothetical protein
MNQKAEGMDSPKEVTKKEQTTEPRAHTKALNWMASLMFLQLLTRAFHFIFNLALVRFLSPENYGKSALQLPLISMAITRIMKEALHRTAVREMESSQPKKREKGANSNNPELNVEQYRGKSLQNAENLVLVWWSVPVSVVLSSTLSFIFVSSSETVQVRKSTLFEK